ncbi:hypothetical protein EV363DRAFT_1322237 [Boletus edulis]|uniref:Uncharacterized protein n=1 Tax=Boletus edulis BED1 TaxID=1328754 RepID=A0AAD4BY76_BOLED|nr:hypothetical protein EV363DRAFT_1322237 [Boletus edulis]KAF8442400.1 hypothetical protein L210DRAFT_3536519 [Boletus edulis BED1]
MVLRAPTSFRPSPRLSPRMGPITKLTVSGILMAPKAYLNITIAVGDIIQLTLIVWEATSALAMVDNLSNCQSLLHLPTLAVSFIDAVAVCIVLAVVGGTTVKC